MSASWLPGSLSRKERGWRGVRDGVRWGMAVGVSISYSWIHAIFCSLSSLTFGHLTELGYEQALC